MEVGMRRMFLVLVMIVGIALVPMARDAEAIQATPHVYVHEWSDSTGLIFKVNNDEPGTAFGILIGAVSSAGPPVVPPGDPQGGIVMDNGAYWQGKLLDVKSQNYDNGHGGSDTDWGAYLGGTEVLKGLNPAFWSGVSYAYLFYASSLGDGIVQYDYGLFYVNGGAYGSPWASIHQQLIDFTKIPTVNGTIIPVPGYAVSFQGMTIPEDLSGTPPPPRLVPIPSALLLLGPGLVGLAAVRRKIKK
jgi:hypothetical protein